MNDVSHQAWYIPLPEGAAARTFSVIDEKMVSNRTRPPAFLPKTLMVGIAQGDEKAKNRLRAVLGLKANKVKRE